MALGSGASLPSILGAEGSGRDKTFTLLTIGASGSTDRLIQVSPTSHPADNLRKARVSHGLGRETAVLGAGKSP